MTNKQLPPGYIDTGTGLRLRIVCIMAATEVVQRLGKKYKEAELMAGEAFEKLYSDTHYPTEEEVLAECGIVIDPREGKSWPKEEDCPGCDRHKDGPHRFGCKVHGKKQVVLTNVTLKERP